MSAVAQQAVPSQTTPRARAVVTGGSRGLGLAIAQRLRCDGIEVWTWDLVPPSDPEQLAHHCQVDVSDWKSVRAAADRTLAIGEVSILVNNAGMLGPVARTLDVEIDDWRRILDVNLTGAFLCVRALVPAMQQAGKGRVVNIASIAGKHTNANGAAYGASKAGLISLTKSLARELAKTGVLVNCVTPSVFESTILDHMEPVQKQRILDALGSKAPMGRILRADEVAAMVAWLSSDACSYSTGAIFDLSGGRSEY